jgi:4-hydroxy-2-oxoheptanedioate aldolase
VFDTALATVVAACRNHGIVPGIHASASLAARRGEQGFRMITVSSDLMALQKGAADDLAMARAAGSGDGGTSGSGAGAQQPGGDRVY